VRSDDHDRPTLREPHPSLPTRVGSRAPRPDGAVTGDQPALTWISTGRHDLRRH
jgi:hypothetical protein